MAEFTLEAHDCSHKYLDDTKTCAQLFLNRHFGVKTSIVCVQYRRDRRNVDEYRKI